MEQATKTQNQLRGVKYWTSPAGERRVLPAELEGVKLTASGFPNKLHAKYAAFKAWADAPYNTGETTAPAAPSADLQGQDGPSDEPGEASAATETAPAPAESRAQVLALRIWGGQSPDVAVIERVARIAAGLKEQGLGLDIELPHADAGRYLDAHR